MISSFSLVPILSLFHREHCSLGRKGSGQGPWWEDRFAELASLTIAANIGDFVQGVPFISLCPLFCEIIDLRRFANPVLHLQPKTLHVRLQENSNL
jgi:hypothetical protein